MDTFWLKTLANSKYYRGSWQLENPQEVKEYNRVAIYNSVNDIYQDLVLSVNSFNNFVETSSRIHVLPIYCEEQHIMKGFMIMLRNFKIRLERDGAKIVAVLESTRSFRELREHLHQFNARMDALGGLTWVMDGKTVMSNEMIVKQLLHDLWSSIFEVNG